MDEVMRAYFEKMKSKNFPLKRELSDYDLKIMGEGCKGGGSGDDIVFFIKKEGDKIKEMTYLCNYCIPPSYIAANVICKFAKGKTLSQVKNMTPQDIKSILGGDSPRMYDLIGDVLKSFNDE